MVYRINMIDLIKLFFWTFINVFLNSSSNNGFLNPKFKFEISGENPIKFVKYVLLQNSITSFKTNYK